MKYCVNCGAQLEDKDQFCSNCGTKIAQAAEPEVKAAVDTANTYATDSYTANAYTANTYATPQASPQSEPAQPLRSPGKSITGFALGIGSLACAGIGLICAFCALIRYIGITFMVYAIIFGLFAVGCGIAGLILSIKALEVEPDNSRSRMGKIFSLVGLIAGGAAVLFGIIFGVIGIARW